MEGNKERASCNQLDNSYNADQQKKDKSSSKFFDNLEWLTTAEAAFYLRKSCGAVRQMVHRGQLRARKFHRRLYFNKMELEQMLDISFY